MAVAVLFLICHFSLCLSQVSGASAGISGIADQKMQEFLAVAEAVAAVDRAGGPRTIMEDPKYKHMLQPLIMETLQGLSKIKEKQENVKEDKVKPRFFENLVISGIKAIINVYKKLTAPDQVTTVDPDMVL